MVDDGVHVCCYLEEAMASGCTIGKETSGGSVMISTMFCWDILIPIIHTEDTLLHITYVSILKTGYTTL